MMEMNQNIQDRIDEYLRGNLPEADKAAFEEELLENDELRKRLRHSVRSPRLFRLFI